MKDAELRLTNTEDKTLRVIVLHFAEEPFTCDALEAAAPWALTGYEAEIGVARLRRRGIVTTRKKAWGERIHSLTTGVFDHWRQAYMPASPDDWTVADEHAAPHNEPKRGLASLLFGLLAIAQFEGLPLTQKGTLHKRDLQRVTERFDVTDSEFAGMQCSYMHQDKYGISFAVVYDAALRLGLLNNGVDQSAPVEGKVLSWLELSAREMDERLLKLWWEVYTPNDVWLQQAAALLRSLPQGRWTTARRMADTMLAAGVPAGSRSAEEAALAVASHWLKPMRALGWLESGSAANDPEQTAYRWRGTEEGGAAEAADNRWYVQPDFEVIVTPAVPYSLRWELEAAAVYEGGEYVERYRLTKHSWQRAIECGRDSERLIETLRGGAKYGLPSNVEDTLREWGEQYGTVKLEQATLLRCRDAYHAEQIRSHPQTTSFIAAQLSDRDFIVFSGKADELFSLLERQGYSPRKTNAVSQSKPRTREAAGEAPPAARIDAASSDWGDRPQGIIFEKRTASLFPVDPAPPAPELQAVTDSVPQSWVKQFRRYHLSTMRDLMETAARIKTTVKLGRDGAEHMFYPRRIERAGDRFRAVGYMNGSEVSIIPEEWEEVQLLLPD
ncbi:helicase-associated domain-containing protein [Paenibacillus alkalitolerans]|uniref:helicase-associated domain-containing protein n=1 Tax=Paenibacillus alkalitolerans TaxID=2799335 RepID=UPI001F2A4D1F|nr:helicase-associated domain-containing protein [Paenibacillus alkalitolerans]